MDEALAKLERRENLEAGEMADAMNAIMTGRADVPKIEKFLTLLREKGETITEIMIAAVVMREHMTKLKRPHPDVIDTCGTGGDGGGTLNISTLVALTVAACGVKVAKHGNRSVSSSCGSADILEALGIPLTADQDTVENCLDSTGFAFFFAPNFHPAMRHAMPARKNIKGKTIFNLLGPLSNPAEAKRQVVGVYSEALTETIAKALQGLGSDRALVVHGGGIDEISLSGPTRVSELKDGAVTTYEVRPSDFGLPESPVSALKCASVAEAKEAALGVLGGKNGPMLDITALNAGAALYVAGKMPSIKEGVVSAKDTLLRGEAAKKLDEISKAMRRA